MDGCQNKNFVSEKASVLYLLPVFSHCIDFFPCIFRLCFISFALSSVVAEMPHCQFKYIFYQFISPEEEGPEVPEKGLYVNSPAGILCPSPNSHSNTHGVIALYLAWLLCAVLEIRERERLPKPWGLKMGGERSLKAGGEMDAISPSGNGCYINRQTQQISIPQCKCLIFKFPASILLRASSMLNVKSH